MSASPGEEDFFFYMGEDDVSNDNDVADKYLKDCGVSEAKDGEDIFVGEESKHQDDHEDGRSSEVHPDPDPVKPPPCQLSSLFWKLNTKGWLAIVSRHGQGSETDP